MGGACTNDDFEVDGIVLNNSNCNITLEQIQTALAQVALHLPAKEEQKNGSAIGLQTKVLFVC